MLAAVNESRKNAVIARSNESHLQPDVCTEFKRIVVGVDFSPITRSVLIHAARIASWDDAWVRVLHVVDRHVVHEIAGALRRTPEHPLVERHITQSNLQRLFDLRRNTETSPRRMQYAVRFGKPCSIFGQTVRAWAPDLLVLGTNGLGDARNGLGTLAAKAVRRFSSNVLLVRGEEARFRRIVACVDFRPASLKAVRIAAYFAKHERAKLHLIHVFSPPWEHHHYRAPTLEIAPSFQAEYNADLTACLEQFVRPIESAFKGLDVEHHIIGNTSCASGILDFTRQIDADLLILGTRSNWSLGEMLLGTTAKRVMREASCAMLVAKR